MYVTVRFHWTLSSVRDTLRRSRRLDTLPGIPDLATHVEFCEQAARAGLDTVLLAIGLNRPDPPAWATALGAATEKVRFMCAVRPGLSAPAYTVQQLNTAAALTGGRVCVNAVIGHSPENKAFGDLLDHDERYARATEFWSICHALWTVDGPVTFRGTYYTVDGLRMRTRFTAPGRSYPEIYFGGNSESAERLTADFGVCLLQMPQSPEAMAPSAARLAPHGATVGMHVSLLLRPTRAEAVRAAQEMLAGFTEQSREVHRDFRGNSDSVAYQTMYALGEDESGWVTPYLWSGAVPYLGAPGIALVGGPAEIVEAIWQYRAIGVTEFMFAGWPDFETLELFGREVAPVVRQREAATLKAA